MYSLPSSSTKGFRTSSQQTDQQPSISLLAFSLLQNGVLIKLKKRIIISSYLSLCFGEQLKNRHELSFVDRITFINHIHDLIFIHPTKINNCTENRKLYDFSKNPPPISPDKLPCWHLFFHGLRDK